MKKNQYYAQTNQFAWNKAAYSLSYSDSPNLEFLEENLVGEWLMLFKSSGVTRNRIVLLDERDAAILIMTHGNPAEFLERDEKGWQVKGNDCRS